MLVVSRAAGESISIAGGIEILVLRSSKGRVRLGIRAPAETRVLRSELHPIEQDRKEVVEHATE